MASYNIDITNGTGSENVLSGNYTVTSTTTGYDNSTIDPSSITVSTTAGTFPFTIAATGTLTLHVSEEGTAGGTAIVGATFIRTDATGNEYGNAITSDSNGNAVFNNVPFAASGAPLIYYKQTASDGAHEFDNTVKSTTLTAQTGTVEIQNAAPALNTFGLTDANYENLPVTGQINLNE